MNPLAPCPHWPRRQAMQGEPRINFVELFALSAEGRALERDVMLRARYGTHVSELRAAARLHARRTAGRRRALSVRWLRR